MIARAMVVTMTLLLAGCPTDPELRKAPPMDAAADAGVDVGADVSWRDVSWDFGEPYDWGYYDWGYEDWGYYDSGYQDWGYYDAGYYDVGYYDVGYYDAGYDLGADLVEADAGRDGCFDGPGSFMSDGMGNTTCDTAITCGGVDYVVDCINDNCSCAVDGQAVMTTTMHGCTYDGLRECGAPIPPVNPTCYADDIYSGGGGGFCEAGVTCNDIDFKVKCVAPNGPCTCTVDDAAGPMSTASNCISDFDALIECGAPLQPDP